MNPRSSPPPRNLTKRIAVVGQEVPSSTGFVWIEGAVDFISQLRRIRITVLLTRAKGNHGPVPFHRVEEEWTAARQDFRGMRLRLVAELQEVSRRLQSGEWPVRGTWIETCNPSRAEDFFEKVCMGCRCPYCELSS